MASTTTVTRDGAREESWEQPTPFDRWIETLDIPIHRGYFVPDARTIELGWWPQRQCNAAFLQLVGLEGVSEVRVSEIAAGKSVPAFTPAVDEIVYVLEGRGLTNLSWAG